MNQLSVNTRKGYAFTLLNERLKQSSHMIYQDCLGITPSSSYHCSMLCANNFQLDDCAKGLVEFTVIVETILSCVTTLTSGFNVTPSPVVTSSNTLDYKTSWIFCVVPAPPYPGFPSTRDSSLPFASWTFCRKKYSRPSKAFW